MRHVLNTNQVKILVVGAGFIGVEWTTEIDCFFPEISLAIIDALPRALGSPDLHGPSASLPSGGRLASSTLAARPSRTP